MGKYAELVKKIGILEGEINEKKESLRQAEAFVENSRHELDALWESFKQKVLTGEEAEAARVQKKTDEFTANIRKNRAFFEALTPRIQEMEAALGVLLQEKNRVFVRQAKKWFESEIGSYDDLAIKLLNSIRRLFIAYELLREIGEQETGKNLIGESFSYLSAIKLPLIRAFDREVFTQEGKSRALVNNPRQNEVERVLEEIISR